MTDSQNSSKTFGPLLNKQIDILDEARKAKQIFEVKAYKNISEQFEKTCEEFEASHSGGRLGKQADVYIRNFKPKTPADHFDTMWGFERTPLTRHQGDWVIYDRDAVERELWRRVGNPDGWAVIFNTTKDAEEKLRNLKVKALANVNVIMRYLIEDGFLKDKAEKISKIKPFLDHSFVRNRMLHGEYRSWDTVSMQQGVFLPVHQEIYANYISRTSVICALDEFIDEFTSICEYIETIEQLERHNLTKQLPESILKPIAQTNISPIFNNNNHPHIEAPMSQHNNNINGSGNVINAPSASNGSSVTMGDVTQTTTVTTNNITQDQFNKERKDLIHIVDDQAKDLGPFLEEVMGQFLRMVRDIQVEGKETQEIVKELNAKFGEAAQKVSKDTPPPTDKEGALAKIEKVEQVAKKSLSATQALWNFGAWLSEHLS